MKFQAIKTLKTTAISSLTTDRLILPEEAIELRWIKGDKWVQAYMPVKADWKSLCKAARIVKTEFIKHLEGK